VALHDDVLQPLAQHRLDGVLVLGRRRDHVRHEPEDAAVLLRLALAGARHQAAHAAPVALVVPHHLGERGEPRALVAELLAQRDELRLVLDELGAGPLERLLLRAALRLQPQLQLAGLAELLDVLRAGSVEVGAAAGDVAGLAAVPGQARAEVRPLPLHLGELAAVAGRPPERRARLGARRLHLTEQRTRLAGEVADLRVGLGEARLVGAAQRAQLLTLPFEPVALGGERLRLRLERLHLRRLDPGALADLLQLARRRLDRHLRDARLARELVLALGELARAELHLAEAQPLGLDGGLQLGEPRRELLPLGVEQRLLLLGGAPQRRDLEVTARAVRELELADLRLHRLVLLRLARLPVQALQLLAELLHDVDDAGEVLRGGLHLPLGRLAPPLVLRDAGRLLDDGPPILRARRHDLSDAALLDDGVGGAPDARPREEVVHVQEARGHLVDEVLRLAGAEEPPPDRDLAEALVVRRQLARAVVLEGDEHLGHRERRLRLRAVEDDVLHRAAAQLPRRLLAEHPADGVGDVRLAAAVRPHHARHPLGEGDDGAVHERLEANDIEAPDAHGVVRSTPHGAIQPTPGMIEAFP
jgi:hypothetical protein